MADKVKNLTDILCDGTVETEIKSGNVALKNKAYEQAWEHFYKVYNAKDTTNDEKGLACYELFTVMTEMPLTDPFLKKLISIDPDLIRMSKTKEISNEYARRYIGRKYLEKSAQYNYKNGLIEYGLSCVDCAPQGGFPYKFNEENASSGLDWAHIMKRSDDREIRAAAYIIYSKYYFVKRTEELKQGASREGETNIVKEYGDNAIKASKDAPNDQYVNYFLAHLYANPLFKGYKKGTYYNPKKGYDLFCKVLETGNDPELMKSAREVKYMLETKYPTKIGKR